MQSSIIVRVPAYVAGFLLQDMSTGLATGNLLHMHGSKAMHATAYCRMTIALCSLPWTFFSEALGTLPQHMSAQASYIVP